MDDQRVVSGILHVIRNGLRWRRIAMRDDRCAHTFFSAILLAAVTLVCIHES